MGNRKRRTARSVTSTRSCAWAGVPYPGQERGTPILAGEGYPSHGWGVPLSWLGDTPVDGQSENILLIAKKDGTDVSTRQYDPPLPDSVTFTHECQDWAFRASSKPIYVTTCHKHNLYLFS